MKKEAREMKSEFLSIRVSPSTKAALETIAESQDRTLSWLVSRILETHVEKAALKRNRRTEA